jgi:hypothetical protein
MNDQITTITITDPNHEFYNRVAKVVSESDWYTHVRMLYHSNVIILEKTQYRANQ